MKNLIFVTLLGVGLMSCSMIEGAMGENADVSSLGGLMDTIWTLLKGFLPSLAAWEGGRTSEGSLRCCWCYHLGC